MRPNVAQLNLLYQTSENELPPWCNPISEANETNTVPIKDNPFDELLPTLIECFVIVLFGYLAGKLNMIVGTEIKGLSRFASEFSLPALIFSNLINIDFQNIDWSFVVGILIGKLTVFVIVAFITVVVQKPFNLATSGIYAIFCTQGNDFGLAYPIVVALYGVKHPLYPGYMYLIAPISLIILNPIGFLMIEMEKFRSTSYTEDMFANRWRAFTRISKIIASVIWEVLRNPNVFMTILGVAGNFFLKDHLPESITRILQVLSNAFEATVLFLLGFSILGSGSSLAGAGLLVPGVLLAVKMLASPLIIRATVQLLCADKPDAEDLSNFGFLFGMVPTGPIVLLFATQYNLPTEVLASTMVVCTFLTGPIMFVLAKMVTMNVTGVTEYATQMGSTLLVLGILGLIASLWVCLIIISSGRWRRPIYTLTLCLTTAQILMSIGLLVWYGIAKQSTGLAYLHVALITGGQLASRLWTAILSLALVLFTRFPKYYFVKILRYCLAVGFGSPIVIMILLILISGLRGHLIEDKKDIPLFLYGNDEAITSTFVISVCLVVTLSSLVMYYRFNAREDSSEIPEVRVERSVEQESTKFNAKELVECTKLAVYKLRKNSTSGIPSCLSSAQTPSRKFHSVNSTSSMNELIENEKGDTSASTSEVNDSDLSDVPEKSLRHVVYLILLIISMCVGLTVSVWKLITNSPTGMFVAVEFLDVVLNFGQGIFAAVIFGSEIMFIITPVMKVLRKAFYSKTHVLKPIEDLKFETRRICQQFLTYHYNNCVKELPKTLVHDQTTYENCFYGKELVDWLLDAGLTGSRYEANQYGRHLLDGRVICHIELTRHFHDGQQVYRFVTQPEVP